MPTLAELIGQGHDIACVYAQPPRPKGRGLGSEPSPVHALALAHGIAVRIARVTLKAARRRTAGRCSPRFERSMRPSSSPMA